MFCVQVYSILYRNGGRWSGAWMEWRGKKRFGGGIVSMEECKPMFVHGRDIWMKLNGNRHRQWKQCYLGGVGGGKGEIVMYICTTEGDWSRVYLDNRIYYSMQNKFSKNSGYYLFTTKASFCVLKTNCTKFASAKDFFVVTTISFKMHYKYIFFILKSYHKNRNGKLLNSKEIIYFLLKLNLNNLNELRFSVQNSECWIEMGS